MIGGYRQALIALHQGSRLFLLWLSLLLCIWFGLTATARAQNTSIAQGFKTNETSLTAGALVSLEPNDNGRVEFANVERADQLVGVAADKPLVTLSSDSSEVQVVMSGITPTLVSNINGDVKVGDRITASPIYGVGMKAVTASQVVGIAQEDFASIKTQEFTVPDRDGKNQVIRAGLLQVQINVTRYVPIDEQNTSLLPPFLQQFANSVAGHEVPVLRVLISLLILLLGFVSTGVILYSSVQSSIISIGRNPLSQGAVRKSLLQVGATGIGILLVMVIAIYLILTT